MRRVNYTDLQGRKFLVEIPDNKPDSEAVRGVRIGPPDLAPLGLPVAVEVRLNNALHARKLWDRASSEQCRDALMAALKLDAFAIAELYRQNDGDTVTLLP